MQGPHKDGCHGWHATRQFYEWVYATRQFQAIPIVVKNWHPSIFDNANCYHSSIEIPCEGPDG